MPRAAPLQESKASDRSVRPTLAAECLGPSASGRQPLEWKIFPGSLTLMRFPFGVQMTVVRAGRLLAVLGVILAGSGCGDTYRPIAIPIQPVPPTPAALHYVVSLSMNGVCPPQAGENCGRGASTRIDVSGDSSVGTAQVGLNPVHAVVTPNGSSVYVANQMEDTVSFYSPSNVAPVSSVSLPGGSAPVFVAATDNTSVYVANSGTNTVSDI